MRTAFLTALGLMVLAPSTGFAQQRDSRVQEFLELVQRPLLYPIQPARVETRAGIVAGKRQDGSPLTVDLYLPKQATDATRPIAMLLHGGLPDAVPIKPSEWRMYRDWGTALAQSGIVAVMFNHSLGYPQRRLDTSAAEIDQVLRWLRDHHTEHRVDAQRLTVIAFSAGGLLIPELVRRYEPSSIRRYALFYPLLGVDADASNAAEIAQRTQFVSAVPLLASRHTPLLIIRAGADQQPDLLTKFDDGLRTALKADVALELINVPGAPHGFDSTFDDALTRQVIERAIDFAAATQSE
jgi:acetyl esterase/lipase